MLAVPIATETVNRDSSQAPLPFIERLCFERSAVPEMVNNTKIFKMAFARVYPLYIAKVERKGRTRQEVDAVIHWLTGYDDESLERHISEQTDFETFFARAPRMNPNASKITGVICGHRIEEIEHTLMRQIRYLDKLVDELAKGRAMDKILRS